jgi:HEAT repeat protein
VRRAAATALGAIKSEAAVGALIARLEHSDAEVRRAAATALGAIKSEAAVEPLIARLEDSAAEVRRAAVGALSRSLSDIDRRLLTSDLDAVDPFLDPREVVRNAFTQTAASKMNMTIEEVRARYEALADRFRLSLEWRPPIQASADAIG